MTKQIYEFIQSILPKYEILTSVEFVKETNEFYIRYDYPPMTFDLRNILNRELLQEIWDFCVDNNLTDTFKDISIFVVIDTKEH